MSRIYAISYGDKNYTMSLRINLWSARLIGKADKVFSFGPRDIDESFRREHNDIMQEHRGGGLWLWKPYVIAKVMREQMNDGDYLMYADSGTVYVNSIRHLQKVLERDHQDILLSSSCFIEGQWSKRDAFEYMGVDFNSFRQSFQTEATFILIKKSDFSMRFVNEWLEYCFDRRIISDDPNTCNKPNDKGFRENRHDQTVLSLLGKKYGIPAYRGISDSSEIAKFDQYSDDNFFGICKAELIQNAKRHRLTDIYQRGTYPRVMVNTRLQNSGWLLFLKRVYRKIRHAKLMDSRREEIEKKYYGSKDE